MSKKRKKQSKEYCKLTVRHCVAIEPQRDFLKYYRIVKYWAKANYGLSEPDLEMLYFLRSEHLFSFKTFKRYNNIFPWDKGRFGRLKKDGWIVKWRMEGMDKNRWALYNVSPKAKRLITQMYKMLNGEEDFPADLHRDPKQRLNAGFTQKTISIAMKGIRKEDQKERLKPVHSRRDGAR